MEPVRLAVMPRGVEHLKNAERRLKIATSASP
jgi:hypothetical protein